MSEEKEITCIVCPIGCKILVKKHGSNIKILEGSKCKRGIEYARSEALDPRRMLTSSILVIGGEWPLVSVKSTQPVSKKQLFSVLSEIKNAKIKAPVKLGQVIIKNVSNTNIDIISTKNINKK